MSSSSSSLSSSSSPHSHLHHFHHHIHFHVYVSVANLWSRHFWKTFGWRPYPCLTSSSSSGPTPAWGACRKPTRSCGSLTIPRTRSGARRAGAGTTRRTRAHGGVKVLGYLEGTGACIADAGGLDTLLQGFRSRAVREAARPWGRRRRWGSFLSRAVRETAGFRAPSVISLLIKFWETLWETFWVCVCIYIYKCIYIYINKWGL